MTSDEIGRARTRYRDAGYCVSGPLLDEATIAHARLAAGNVIAGRYETGVKPLYRNWNPGDPPRSLVKIDLPHLADRVIQQVVSDTKRVSDLSVGQQRKIELGVLVGSNPDVLLLDEPTNHLSFDVIESLQDAINEFQGPVLIVTHDRRLIRQFARTLWTLREGHLDVSNRGPA